jgi:hypothetical protein
MGRPMASRLRGALRPCCQGSHLVPARSRSRDLWPQPLGVTTRRCAIATNGPPAANFAITGESASSTPMSFGKSECTQEEPARQVPVACIQSPGRRRVLCRVPDREGDVGGTRTSRALSACRERRVASWARVTCGFDPLLAASTQTMAALPAAPTTTAVADAESLQCVARSSHRLRRLRRDSDP